ncbi:MAG: type III pantothenate kinase, partial [Candidatus Krumholzibacteriia bacterium]
AWSTPLPGVEAANMLLAQIDECLANSGGDAMVVTSVVPEIDELLRVAYPDLILIDRESELPFELAVEKRSEVGSDRLCNIAAAVALGLEDAIIVDAGTATTVDVLSKTVFVGGLIAPGMGAAGLSLSQGTAQLPEIPFEKCDLEPGRSTATAMRSGIFHAGIGGVEALISGMLLKYGPLPIVLTGGLGWALVKQERLFDPDWTMRGALELANQR